MIHGRKLILHKNVKDWIRIAKKSFTLHLVSNNPSKKRIKEVAKQLNNYFNSDTVLGIRLIAVFSDNEIKFSLKEDIKTGKIDDIYDFSWYNNIDEIFYTMPLTYTKKIKSLVDFCDKYMIRLKIVPDFRGFLFKRVNIDYFDDVPIITLREEPNTDYMNRIVKR